MSLKGLNQLLCAALVDRRFRNDLLKDPVQSSRMAYLGHLFELSPAEERMLEGIKVESLEDFTTQVYNWLQSQPFHMKLMTTALVGQYRMLP